MTDRTMRRVTIAAVLVAAAALAMWYSGDLLQMLAYLCGLPMGAALLLAWLLPVVDR